MFTSEFMGRNTMMQSILTSRKTFFSIIILALVLVITVILAELVGYFVLVKSGKNAYLPLALNDIDSRTIPEETRAAFDHRLGWEPHHPNDEGYRGEPKDFQQAALAVFGDSYTQGHPRIEKSWPYRLEQQLGRPVLNFGVGGYGTDQAYLRFEERYVGKLHTPYAALFVMPENIGRIVNRYRGFHRRQHVSFTKPMFHKSSDGKISLLPNPLTLPDELTKLGDMRFLKEIGIHDYWFQYYQNYGLNQYVKFPYSYQFVKAIPYYTQLFYNRRIKLNYAYAALYKDQRALEVLDYILNAFATRAEKLGVVPMIGFLPARENMVRYQETGKAVYQDYVRDLASRDRVLVIDGLDFFAPYLERGADPSSFFISDQNGHYNAIGEDVVSEGMYRTLLNIDADKKLIGFGSKDMTLRRN